MTTFLMLGRYSLEGVKGASPNRTQKIADQIAKCSGKVSSMYALLGGYDLAFVVDFPGITDALKASFMVSKATGISFSTIPALPVEEFDRMIG